ncbi:hypothetical protein BU679_08075 [Staphylococcus chromogenes]|uniref:DUF2975 domain-containing protein n=1 Tax=Staphylococcus chromogenes TaxID=46126 RepID=UPI000D1BEEE3|nr:DUF2975 domain-containing protein [Staphylococcus chromogenes]MCE4966295.1 DUF2975 domain-containing protein [Staphylococcus chromogenes]PTF74123.1 hypothetical protein BUX97_11185 [Staphylococcus chromogenes]PTF84885.1 hypothetical protein BU686_00945 [Staphylococcus chromogenes]PTG51091.1 hypothetical protein BU679_08075 [Staphylococcus chromogenes]PTG57576.1 hypothetical protein BU682_10580 [Staphylococcus chromogenes]
MNKKALVLIFLYVLVMFLTVLTSILSIWEYYKLIGKPFFEVQWNYQVYALLFVLQLCLFILMGILTLRLFLKVYKNFEFIDKHYYSIVGVALALFIYGALSNIISFTTIGGKYVEVLNSHQMTNTLVLVMGSAMFVLSVIYEKSQKIKKENDLTV